METAPKQNRAALWLLNCPFAPGLKAFFVTLVNLQRFFSLVNFFAQHPPSGTPQHVQYTRVVCVCAPVCGEHFTVKGSVRNCQLPHKGSFQVSPGRLSLTFPRSCLRSSQAEVMPAFSAGDKTNSTAAMPK